MKILFKWAILFFLSWLPSNLLSSIIDFIDFNYNDKNVSWAPNQYVRMISEGSCDPDDWSNDAEKFAY